MKRMIEKGIADLRKELYAIVYQQVNETLERKIQQAAALHMSPAEIVSGLTKGPSPSPAAQRASR